MRFCGPGQPYEGLADRETGLWTGKVRMVPEHLADPLRWKRPRRIFVNSMSDLFHEDLANEEIAAVFGVMAMRPKHTFQVLTKRARRMREWFEWLRDGNHRQLVNDATRAALGRDDLAVFPTQRHGMVADPGWPLPNVWLGVSVEDQQRADERIPELLATPAAVRFLSCEPLIGSVDLDRWVFDRAASLRHAMNGRAAMNREQADSAVDPMGIDWVIVGGESGPGARPMALEWASDIVSQCRHAQVSVFVKQLGPAPMTAGRCHDCADNDGRCPNSGLPCAGLKDKKGGDIAEFPPGLRVRQFPEV